MTEAERYALYALELIERGEEPLSFEQWRSSQGGAAATPSAPASTGAPPPAPMDVTGASSMPPGPPPEGYYWDAEYDPVSGQSVWALAPTSQTRAGGPRTLPPGSPPTMTDANGNVYGWNDQDGGYTVPMGYDPSADRRNQPEQQQSFINPLAGASNVADPSDPWAPYGVAGMQEPVGAFTDPSTGIRYRSIFNPNTGRLDEVAIGRDPNWVDPSMARQKQQAEEFSATERYRQSQLDIERQQMTGLENYRQAQLAAEAQRWQAQLAADREQRAATLQANPASWLEYAVYTKTAPAVQPWMVPLMGKQYAGTVAGAPLPGFDAGAPKLSDLPRLTDPSRQYQARMGPTSLQQYYGYQQAATGARPEETDFRLWSQAPPGGANTNLRFNR